MKKTNAESGTFDQVSVRLSRRRFVAAMGASAFAMTFEGYTAPLLFKHKNRSIKAANSWLEVDLQVFERNISLVQAMATGGAKCCAIMKADAYGSGIDVLIPSVVRAGIEYIGISSNDEARLVRTNGYRGKLLRVRAASEAEILAAHPYHLEELTGSFESAEKISRIAGRNQLPIHLNLNSAGMSRAGIELRTQSGRDELQQVMKLPGLRVVGLMTHFPVEDAAQVRAGLATFKLDVGWILANTNIRREEVLLHAASSFALQNIPEAHLDMVRAGGALYGYSGTPKPPFGHVIAFKTRVASIQTYPAGSTVSYDRSFTLERDSVLANLSVGYSDGYVRAYSNKGSVLIRGQRAPVLGRVTMNSTMVDVTDIPEASAGDEVVLFGKQGHEQLTQAELQSVSGLGLAEQYTAWGALNPRFVLPLRKGV